MSARLNLSPRSLRRQSQAEGSSYQQLIDRVHYQLAQRYLQQQHWSIDSIAGLLGYSEVASFSRAFKRWSGQSPGQFRKQFSQ